MSARRFEPGRKVHAAADYGVIHPVIATEIPDRAYAGIDAHPALQGLFQSRLPPNYIQLLHALAHCNRHGDAGYRIFLDSKRLGIAEKDDDGVADIFVDGRAMPNRDLGHLGQILVEKTRQVFRFQLLGCLRKSHEVGERTVSRLRWLASLTSCLPEKMES